MKDVKLFQLLRKLNKQELKSLGKFLESPYFNTNKNIIVLWNYVSKYAPEFNSRKLKAVNIFTELFPKKKFNERVLRQLRYQLLKLVEQFLAIEAFQTKEFYQDFLLAKSYQKLASPKDWKMISQQALAKNNDNQHIWSYLHQMRWWEFQYFSDVSSKLEQNASSIKKMDDALDLFLIGAKLKYACELISWNQIVGANYHIHLLHEIEALCKKNLAKLPSFHLLYWMAYQLIIRQNEGIFITLKYHFLRRRKDLAKEEQIILLTYLLNFTFRKIQQHKTDYFMEAFKLYEFGIKNNLFLVNNQFLEDHFQNVLTVSSCLKKFKWADNFLKKLNEHSIDVIGVSTYQLSLARLAFAKQLFQVCLDHLSKINHNNVIHSMKGRYITIACYFELGMPKKIIKSKTKAFLHFANRNLNMHKGLQIGCVNFCKIVNELVAELPKKTKIDQLIQVEHKMVFRDWVLAKVKEI